MEALRRARELAAWLRGAEAIEASPNDAERYVQLFWDIAAEGSVAKYITPSP
jgi:hypothetical protein